jgi:putative transposase
MFAVGQRQSDVARMLHVSRQCVHNWFWQWQGGDGTVRKRRPGSGRKAKLGAEQLARVDAALRRGPRAHGYPGERWTLWRVASVIEKITGVHYHPSSVWRILRALGWTLQLPPVEEQPDRPYIPREWTPPEGRTGKIVH